MITCSECKGDTEDPEDPENPEVCSICLDSLTAGAEVLLLPCKHFFHKVCMEEWLKQGRAICPFCKQGIMDDDEMNWFVEGRANETSRLVQKWGKDLLSFLNEVDVI